MRSVKVAKAHGWIVSLVIPCNLSDRKHGQI